MSRKRKLPAGFGSISKRKEKCYKKYVVRGSQPNREFIGSYATYAEAFEALTKYDGKNTMNLNSTVKDVYESWSGTNEFQNMSKAVQVRYNGDYNKLKPIHDRPVKEIINLELQTIIDHLENEGYESKERHEIVIKKYSKDSLKRIITCMNKIFQHAERNRLILSNPAKNLLLTTKGSKKEINILTDLELAKMFKKANDNKDVKIILVNTFLGLRPQEMVNLTKFHIDLQKNTVRGMGVKTDAGKDRTVLIHPLIQAFVKDLYNDCNNHLVERFNRKVSVKTYREKIFYKALNDLEIEKKTPYVCRYTFASLMNRFNVDKETMKSFMGHEDYSTTSNNYVKENMDKNYQELMKINLSF